jgi:hypothetical protein
MDLENSTFRNLKSAILADSQSFLISLVTGATDEQLNAILVRMKQRELQLIMEEGIRLNPYLWKIVETRFANRKPKDIIDTCEGY